MNAKIANDGIHIPASCKLGQT